MKLEIGGGVILISEDLDEILGLADRIVVMRDGKLHDAISNSREDIGLMMAEILHDPHEQGKKYLIVEQYLYQLSQL